MSKSKETTGDSLESQDNAQTVQDGQDADTQNSNTGDGSGDKETKPDLSKKIGLVAFIQSSKPNKYVQAMLKNKRALEAHTLAEWQQIIKDMLNTKVS